MKFAFVASRTQTKDLQDHILRGCDTPPMGNVFDTVIASLHLSIPDFDLSNLAPTATVPFRLQHVLVKAYYNKISSGLEREFELSARQKAVIGCVQSEHAKDFLLAIPMEGLGQRMTPVEYRAILRYRLMIPLYSDGELCPVCKKSRLDAFGDHAAHCKHYPGFKYRHDHVRDILCDVFWRAGVQVKKEAPVNLLTDPKEGRSTLRPADILVYNWSEGKHACVDVTGASPMVGLSAGIFEVGLAASNAAAAKVEKHDGACRANQHSFIPFAFDTFGLLGSEAVELLRRVQKIMDSNVMTAGSNEYVFRRIGFAIQKRLAAQFVARLSSTFV